MAQRRGMGRRGREHDDPPASAQGVSADLLSLIEGCSEAIARGLRAAGYTRYHDDYDDAEQQALRMIIESFADQPRHSPCGFMHTVAKRSAISRTRSEVRQRKVTERLRQQRAEAHIDAYDEGNPSPAELAELVVGSLSPIYRDVVVAYYLENKKVPEIAAELYIAEFTVRSRLQRARVFALQILKEQGHA